MRRDGLSTYEISARLAEEGTPLNAIAMSLTDATAAIIAGSPVGETVLHYPDGGIERCGPQRRNAELAEQVQTSAAGVQLLPESHELVPPPTSPAAMPYMPYRARPR